MADNANYTPPVNLNPDACVTLQSFYLVITSTVDTTATDEGVMIAMLASILMMSSLHNAITLQMYTKQCYHSLAHFDTAGLFWPATISINFEKQYQAKHRKWNNDIGWGFLWCVLFLCVRCICHRYLPKICVFLFVYLYLSFCISFVFVPYKFVTYIFTPNICIWVCVFLLVFVFLYFFCICCICLPQKIQICVFFVFSLMFLCFCCICHRCFPQIFVFVFCTCICTCVFWVSVVFVADVYPKYLWIRQIFWRQIRADTWCDSGDTGRWGTHRCSDLSSSSSS